MSDLENICLFGDLCRLERRLVNLSVRIFRLGYLGHMNLTSLEEEFSIELDIDDIIDFSASNGKLSSKGC